MIPSESPADPSEPSQLGEYPTLGSPKAYSSFDPLLTSSEKVELEDWIASAEYENNLLKKNGETDYYSILSIPRNADDDEIREAYRKKSRLFHPDKHSNSNVKEWASSQFQQIQAAYEVLINPIQRAAYDAVGEKGLASDMEIGSRFMSKHEIRQEFERKARLEKEKDIASLVNSKSEIVLGLNVSVLTSASLGELLLQRGVRIKPLNTFQDMYNVIQRQQLLTKHKFVIPLGNTLNASISGMANFKGKSGVGNIGLGLSHSSAPGVTTEISMPILFPQTATIKRSAQINSGSFYNLEATAHSLSLETPPSVTATYGQLVSRNLTGFLSVRTGNRYYIGEFWKNSPTRVDRVQSEDSNNPNKNIQNTKGKSAPVRNFPRDYSSVTFGVAGQIISDVQCNISSTFSVPQQQVGFHLTKQIDSTFSVDCGLTFAFASHELESYVPIDPRRELDEFEIPRETGLHAIALHVGGDMSITEFEQLGYKLEFGLNSMMTFSLKYSRLGQVFSLPLMISPVFDLDCLFYFLLLPTAFAAGINYFVTKPKKLARLKQRMLDLENEIMQSYTLKKKNSEHIIKLLSPTCDQKLANESAKNGLVITRAFYGDVAHLFDLSKDNSSAKFELSNSDKVRAIDVKVILMALVNDSQLVIPANKSGLQSIVGFYNPLISSLTNNFDKDSLLSRNTDGFFTAKTVSGIVNHIGLIMDSLPKISSVLSSSPSNSFDISSNRETVVQQITKIRPQLFIEYTFKNKLHRAIIDDFSSIMIPLEGHIAEE
ncbi:putative J domain-containing protein [Smittium culicis]|uniref:Putative J domain-containing protein n=2 Tax=Smittium culicis TaxID=133412 RepID=A0A1R1Y2L4_9FUNG|nr:putative J domain-containing protein [Smittium culicis]